MKRRRKYYINNRKKIIASIKKYFKEHPNKRKDLSSKRRARERNAKIEEFSRTEIFDRDNGICHICGKKVKPSSWQLDHIIPLARGGQHTRINVAVSHPLCNNKKYCTGSAQLRMFGDI